MKQTAVEWLSKQISSSKYFYKLMEDIQSRSTVAQSNILNQAKEMEKEQIKDAYESLEHRHGENYYNETFKQQENETDSI